MTSGPVPAVRTVMRSEAKGAAQAPAIGKASVMAAAVASKERREKRVIVIIPISC
jgi:hypothetical protein